ncbi:MAG TPA: Rossmann-like and DUF2520 domain-containing protein [Bacteroidota bacterium]|nr:Rossmann-like and DUF2520 domain-containing protein [Bacteroidota bacterium]
MPRGNPKLSIIGAGAVGSAIGLALRKAGYPVVSVISRTGAHSIALARKLGCRRASTSISDIDPRTEILLLSVSDSALKQITGDIAKLKHLAFRNLFAFHCSGVYSSDILAPLKRKGSVISSIHPVQSFPRTISTERMQARLKHIFFGIEGDPEGIENARALVRRLNGKAVIIPKNMKPLYHAASVFASNYLSVLLNAVDELTSLTGLKESWTEIFGPLLTSTTEQTVRDTARNTLTGPVVRRDFETIRIHLDAILQHAPYLLPLYTVAGVEAARLARSSGRITSLEYEELVAQFRAFVKSVPAKK